MLICKCLGNHIHKTVEKFRHLKKVINLHSYYLIKVYKNMHLSFLFSIIYVTFTFFKVIPIHSTAKT